MADKYFENCKTLEEAKKKYKDLCFKLHPDTNKESGTSELFKEMQSQYEAFNPNKKESVEQRRYSEEAPKKFKLYSIKIIILQESENDTEAYKKAVDFASEMKHKMDRYATVVEIHETPFGSLKARKLDLTKINITNESK